ncbi:MAG TPA: PAS domain S-box protein [Pseudomonas sp.]|nr:PAS domain S-box protein [Pseudomonas sp.]
MRKLVAGFLRLGGFGNGAELARLRAVVEFAPVALLLVDKTGQIVLINAQVEVLFGYPRQELLGQPIEMLVPERIRVAHPGHRASFFANPSRRGMGVGRDLFGLRKDGSEFPAEIGLNPIQSAGETLVLTSIIDISARKREEDRLRLVIESAPNAMLLANSDGRLLLVNAQAQNLFGYSREELLRQPVEALVPERFRGAHAGLRNSFFAAPGKRAMGKGRDLFGQRKDGSEFPIEIGLNPMPSQNETLVLASIIDISERKRVEENSRQLLDELHAGLAVLSSASEAILAATSQVASSTQDTATAISEIATTVEEVKQTAVVAGNTSQSVAESTGFTRQVAQSGRQAVEEVQSGMQQIREQMQAVAESIMRLGEQSQAIGEIVASVGSLAEQSNLLGVNASIEAAKVGEAGKGFAVVAQEVKALAEQSKQATAQVRGILGDIQKAMAKAVLLAEQSSKTVETGYQRAQSSGEAIRSLGSSIEQSSEMAQQIAATSHQQMIGMEQISSAMESIRQASLNNVGGTQQVDQAARDLHQLGLKLEGLAARFKL